MCAIFGLIFQNGHKAFDSDVIKTIVKRLFLENMSRGRTASGLVYTTRQNMAVIKTDIPANGFISMKEYAETENKYINFENDKDGLISILGHCRWKTKGTEKNNDNNHPIVHGNVIGAHNGIITNDDSLFETFSKKIKRKAQVDSEIIFALINGFAEVGTPMHEAISKTSVLLNGSYACSMVHRLHPHMVWLFKNGNPCDILHYKKAGVIIWSSADSYIKNAVGNSLGEAVKIPFGYQDGLTIDTHRNRLYRFPLSSSKTNTLTNTSCGG